MSQPDTDKALAAEERSHCGLGREETLLNCELAGLSDCAHSENSYP